MQPLFLSLTQFGADVDLLHAFSTRQGGVSRTPYATLNLGEAVGDDPQAVHENLARFRRALGLSARPLLSLEQVHGAEVYVFEESAPFPNKPPQADAVITRRRDVVLAIRTADCLPVLFADLKSKTIAAAHAGWRGLVRGVLENTLSCMAALGSEASQLRVAIGPGIGPCCFEVGAEVAGEVSAKDADLKKVLRQRSAEKYDVDLQAAARFVLQKAGVDARRIETLTACTACDPAARFFSYRRDGQQSGRHLSVIAWR